jgi:triacylglycerol lipase
VNSALWLLYSDVIISLKLIAFLLLLSHFIAYNIRPYNRKKAPKLRQLYILISGRECILMAMTCLLLEPILFFLFNTINPSYIIENTTAFTIELSWQFVLALNYTICAILLCILAINGVIRIIISSKQAGVVNKALLVFLWWVPIFNIVLLKRLSNAAIKEYKFVSKKTALNEGRRSEAVCKTKYPLLMVHGIFFRDWKDFNYWGRIPQELEMNGATCFYGNQQSTSSVEDSAAELAECIEKIIAETACEKLNIIAHSKGGLDSRYAISRLGMGKYVSSLTTISTPHYGCNSVRNIMTKIPQKALSFIGTTYETLFSILGDNNPDFMSGLADLTDDACARLNEEMPDDPDVYYQSTGSKMRSSKSAFFPLSLGYSMTKAEQGDNDGLVAISSIEWGNFLGVISPKGKQGISHGDMIDLTRKDIDGFDVCEFYVDLVSNLKERGF